MRVAGQKVDLSDRILGAAVVLVDCEQALPGFDRARDVTHAQLGDLPVLKQAQQMQEKMGKEMKETVVDATAGGGAVTVKMRGDFEVVSLTISPDLVKDGDAEMIQDLTVAALNEAHRKGEETLKGQLGGILPPGLM